MQVRCCSVDCQKYYAKTHWQEIWGKRAKPKTSLFFQNLLKKEVYMQQMKESI